MHSSDLAERLAEMVADADAASEKQQTAIARRMSADGMLRSGNYFIAQHDEIQRLYDATLSRLVEHALSVSAPAPASRAVRTAALNLESRFLLRFESVLAGKSSGDPAPDNVASELLRLSREGFRKGVLRAERDAASNALGKPLRGWQGWLARYGWNAVNSGIAILALYFSVTGRRG